MGPSQVSGDTEVEMKNKSRLQDPAPALNRLFQRLEKKYYSLLAWHGISAIFLMLAATAGLSFILDFTFEMHWTLRLVCLLYTSPSPRDGLLSRMPSSA